MRRCGWCAEPVGIGVLLRAEPCPRCGRAEGEGAHRQALLSNPNTGDGPHSLLDPIEDKWRARRWWLYGLLAAGTFATGTLPFVATLLTVAFFIAMRFLLIREPVQWFGPARRLTSRFTLRMWLLLTSVVTLVANELLTFLPGVNMLLKMLVSVAGAALFVEGSLWFLRGRLRREASPDPSLQWWEWGLPLTLIGVVCALGASLALVLHGLWRLIQDYLP
jgi:hypothetical protein